MKKYNLENLEIHWPGCKFSKQCLLLEVVLKDMLKAYNQKVKK